MAKLWKSLEPILRNLELVFHHNRWTPALAVTGTSKLSDNSRTGDAFLADLKEGIVRAVQHHRRSVERRAWRRIGMPQFAAKPRRDLKVCVNCGGMHEAHTLCGHCYDKVRVETEAIKKAMDSAFEPLKPIDKDIIVKYEGEEVPPGSENKKILDMPRKRPSFFSGNLLEKENKV